MHLIVIQMIFMGYNWMWNLSITFVVHLEDKLRGNSRHEQILSIFHVHFLTLSYFQSWIICNLTSHAYFISSVGPREGVACRGPFCLSHCSKTHHYCTILLQQCMLNFSLFQTCWFWSSASMPLAHNGDE